MNIFISSSRDPEKWQTTPQGAATPGWKPLA